MSILRAMVAVTVIVMAATLNASALAAELTPTQQRAVFDEAQQAYDRGITALAVDPVQARHEFTQAAERFQLLVDQGNPSGALLYNLGNAYLQTGDLGRAIVNYRRAQKLLPGDDRIQNNLDHARSLCRTQIESAGASSLTSALLGWHQRTPLSWRFACFVAANVSLWLAATWWMIRPGSAVRTVAIATGLAWLVLGGSVIADFVGLGRSAEGVLLSDNVTVRKGNGTGFQPSFDQPLHTGVEFQILETRGEWLRIRLANGQDGWIPSQDAATIG